MNAFCNTHIKRTSSTHPGHLNMSNTSDGHVPPRCIYWHLLYFTKCALCCQSKNFWESFSSAFCATLSQSHPFLLTHRLCMLQPLVERRLCPNGNIANLVHSLSRASLVSIMFIYTTSVSTNFAQHCSKDNAILRCLHFATDSTTSVVLPRISHSQTTSTTTYCTAMPFLLHPQTLAKMIPLTVYMQRAL